MQSTGENSSVEAMTHICRWRARIPRSKFHRQRPRRRAARHRSSEYRRATRATRLTSHNPASRLPPATALSPGNGTRAAHTTRVAQRRSPTASRRWTMAAHRRAPKSRPLLCSARVRPTRSAPSRRPSLSIAPSVDLRFPKFWWCMMSSAVRLRRCA